MGYYLWTTEDVNIGLFVNTDDISDLSKKQGGDEARGRFINAVKSSQ